MSDDGPRFMTRRDGNGKFVLMMAAFLLLAYLVQGAQARQDAVLDQQVVNTNAICVSRNITRIKINDLINELETSVRQGTSLPPVEQADRLRRYEALKVPLITCPTT